MTEADDVIWINDHSVEPLATLLNQQLLTPRPAPGTCPICRTARSVHLHLHRFFGDLGGAWIWCSACRRYDHDRRPIPEWWINNPAVMVEALASPPAALEEITEVIDRHWNQFPSGTGDG